MKEFHISAILSMPAVVCRHRYRGDGEPYDVWLSTKAVARRGLIWVLHCDIHNYTALLIGSRATVHGASKIKKHQGAILLPQEHRYCAPKLRGEDEYIIYGEPTQISPGWALRKYDDEWELYYQDEYVFSYLPSLGVYARKHTPGFLEWGGRIYDTRTWLYQD